MPSTLNRSIVFRFQLGTFLMYAFNLNRKCILYSVETDLFSSYYPVNQFATAAKSAFNCAPLKPVAKPSCNASGGSIAYASSTHSSHQAQVPCCVFPQVSTVTPLWSYATVYTA